MSTYLICLYIEFHTLIFFKHLIQFSNPGKWIKGKLHTASLKFEKVWILHLENSEFLHFEISEFEFYPLMFRSIWILHINISEFKFYPIKFESV